MEEFILFALVGFLAQVIDGALGMAYGVICSTVLLAFGVPPARRRRQPLRGIVHHCPLPDRPSLSPATSNGSCSGGHSFGSRWKCWVPSS